MTTDAPDRVPRADLGAGRRLLVEAVRRRRKPLVLATAAAVLYMATLLTIPLVAKIGIDRVIAHPRVGSIEPFVIGLALLAVLRAATGSLRKLQAAQLFASVGADLRQRLYEHMQRQSFAYHEQIGVGQVLSRASSDVNTIETALAMLPFAIQSAMLAVGGVVLLFVLEPLLAAALLLTVFVFSLRIVRLAGPMQFASVVLAESTGAFAQFVSQRISGMRVVKGHGLEKVSREEGEGIIGFLRFAGVELADVRARFFRTSMAIPGVGMVVVVGLGGWMALRGQMTPGDLFAFMQYLWTLVGPVMLAANVASLGPQALAGAARIAEVVRSPVEIVDPAHPERFPAGPGEVRFEDVWFGYEGDDAVLRGFDLAIPGGTSVALVGRSGSGKSTVARLLPRFYDPRRGSVTIDGVPVSKLSLNELRRSIAVVFEDTMIFSETVRNNIAMGSHVGHEQIERAARLAHADEFIRDLPEGYETVLPEGGMGLSGGQRQRLAIARAIVRNPRLLILDDATSALDPATDEAIRRDLREVLAGRTAIIIAHRPETLRLADRVVLIEEGVAVASGTHEELLDIPSYRAALGLDAEIAG